MENYEAEFFKIALICYVIGSFAVLIPRAHQLFAHYFAQVMSIFGSAIILIVAGRYLIAGETALLKVGYVGSYLLGMDSWSAVFLVITGLSGVITSIFAMDYALGYLGKRIRELAGLWNFFLLSMVLVLVAQGAFSFLLAWEVMAIVSFLLVNHESEKKETWLAAYQYLVMTHIGTASIMIAFFVVGSGSLGLNFVDLAKANLSESAQNIAFVAAFLGFALKSGLVPLHVWLPNAHPAAPSHVSALMSGVMLKVAVYGFGRFIFNFLGPVELWWGLIVFVVGLFSAFLGALYAQMEIDIKRILAYSSVENMGIIFAAFGTGMILLTTPHKELAVIGFTAAIVHSFNHSIMKSLLFMSAGAIVHAVEDKNIEKMGGLAKLMPWTAACTLVGAMALAALPLTNGFIGEWLTLQSFVALVKAEAGTGFRLLAAFAFIMLGLTGALALGCFVRLFGVVFLGRARTNRVESAHEVSRWMIIAMVISTVLVLLTGLGASPIVEIAQKVAAENLSGTQMVAKSGTLIWGAGTSTVLYNPLLLVTAAVLLTIFAWVLIYHKALFIKQDVTWNCGTVPTGRQQYSATGFSKPIRRAFDFLLKPKREVVYLQKEHRYFGRRMVYNLIIPDRFTEKLYHPVQHYLVKTASFLRKIQAGSVRMYVSYVMIAMVLALVWGAL